MAGILSFLGLLRFTRSLSVVAAITDDYNPLFTDKAEHNSISQYQGCRY